MWGGEEKGKEREEGGKEEGMRKGGGDEEGMLVLLRVR